MTMVGGIGNKNKYISFSLSSLYCPINLSAKGALPTVVALRLSEPVWDGSFLSLVCSFGWWCCFKVAEIRCTMPVKSFA
jgi:hypothetical protein